MSRSTCYPEHDVKSPPPKPGMTPLMGSAFDGDAKMVSFLLALGPVGGDRCQLDSGTNRLSGAPRGRMKAYQYAHPDNRDSLSAEIGRKPQGLDHGEVLKALDLCHNNCNKLGPCAARSGQ